VLYTVPTSRPMYSPEVSIAGAQAAGPPAIEILIPKVATLAKPNKATFFTVIFFLPFPDQKNTLTDLRLKQI
jgi:hypothetical protein